MRKSENIANMFDMLLLPLLLALLTFNDLDYFKWLFDFLERSKVTLMNHLSEKASSAANQMLNVVS